MSKTAKEVTGPGVAAPKMSGMDVLLPDTTVTLAGGEQVTVRPLTFTQIPQGAIYINALVRAAMESGALTEEGDLDLARLGGLLATAGEPIFQLIVLCTGLPRDRLDALSIEDGLELAAAVARANWRPELIKKIQAMAEKISSSIGSKPSPDLSARGTDSPT